MEKIAFLRSFDISWLSPALEEATAEASTSTRLKIFHTGDCGDPSGYFPESELLDPEADCEEIAERIRSWGAEGVISLSWPDENALRDAIVGEKLRKTGIPAVTHGADVTARLSNKWETRQLIQAFGLDLPEGELLDGDILNGRAPACPSYRALIEAKADRLGWPLLVKPLWGCSCDGIRFIEDAAALRRYLDRPCDGNAVLEQCVRGDLCSVEIIGCAGEYVFQPLVWKGATEESDPSLMSERVRICGSVAEAEADFVPVARLLRRLCTETGIHGAIEVEMIYADGIYRIVEVNPRTSGTTVISSAASGCNTIRCLLDILRGEWSAQRVRSLERQTHYALQMPIAPDFDATWLGDAGVPDSAEVVRMRNFAYHDREFGEIMLRCPATDAPALTGALARLGPCGALPGVRGDRPTAAADLSDTP